MNTNLLANDLDHILAHTEDIWEEMRGQRIFITGGTGFFGCWLLESFVWANKQLSLNATAVVLTRSVERFLHKAPHLASDPALQFHIGDVRDFDFPEGHFSHIIHAATEASATLNAENPLLMLGTIIEGTRHTLDFARQSGAVKFLLTSSGAVYGRQLSSLTHTPEDWMGAPDTMAVRSAYGHGKRIAEHLCAIYADQYGIETKIARCFAFVGPYLPLDGDFAIGNFIRDCLEGNQILVKGDGTPYRSYLYAADLTIWIWTVLCKGEVCRPYNIGSEQYLTIAELAQQVAYILKPAVEVRVAQDVSGNPVEWYVPLTTRAYTELSLKQYINLPDAIRRTICWHMKDGFTNSRMIVPC